MMWKHVMFIEYNSMYIRKGKWPMVDSNANKIAGNSLDESSLLAWHPLNVESLNLDDMAHKEKMYYILIFSRLSEMALDYAMRIELETGNCML